MKYMVNTVRSTLRTMRRAVRRQRECRLLPDIFGAGRSQRVLLSYITEPFLRGVGSRHTNHQECIAIAELFHALGFSVDAIPYFSDADIDFSRYACVFGFGDPVCNSFRHNIPGLLHIHYATGAHPHYQNAATLMRASEVHAKRGLWLLDSCRVANKAWPEQTTLADAIICLGGEWTADTYRAHYTGPIFSLYPSHNAALPQESLAGKDFSAARKNFLWFGGTGALHKGLDLLLEAFAELPDHTLHIAGRLSREKAFMQTLEQEFSAPNIILHGFVDVASPEFAALMRQCAFTVLPSCSEGLATSLLNTMCNGLIPVLTKECGFDPMEYMVHIKSIDKDAVREAISFCDSLGDGEVKERSQKCREHMLAECSLEKFRQNMGGILRQILPACSP